jgi:hypothetical protein
VKTPQTRHTDPAESSAPHRLVRYARTPESLPAMMQVGFASGDP